MKPGKPGERIDMMFAFVVVNPEDDSEGITSFGSKLGHFPMVGADMERVDSLREIAQQIAQVTNAPVEVIRFTNREHIEWIEPWPIVMLGQEL